MNTKVMNYRIIVEKEIQGKKEVYVAHVPTLGISDFGKTIEEAVINTKKAIQLYIETLADMGSYIPKPDSNEYFVTTGSVQLTI